ncbi:MAG: ribonuclease R family protein [Pirellulaceae bacterium]
MEQENLEEQIVALVGAAGYRPMKPRGLLKELRLDDSRYGELRRLIKRLVRAGKLRFAANHLLLPPLASAPLASAPLPTQSSPGEPPSRLQEPSLPGGGDSHRSPLQRREPQERRQPSFLTEASLEEVEEAEATDRSESSSRPERRDHQQVVEGVFRSTQSGYGFFRPDGVNQREEDLFVPPSATGGAIDRDRVRVRVSRGRQGKWEARVLEVIQRHRRQFSGTYLVQEGKSLVWLDGVPLAQPVRLGDVRGVPLAPDDKIIVEVVRFPEGDHPGEAVLLEVLGSARNPMVDTRAIEFQFGLPGEFPSEVIDQSREISDRFQEDVIPEDRKDLTHLPTLTIDPIDARDFDDAISLSVNEVGHWELWVHIADVSAFVQEGTALDDEARERATSIYLPDRVIPMIPEVISNHVASLQPDRNRWAISVLMEWAPEGILVHWEVHRSVIRNQLRLHYEQVDQFLKAPDAFRGKIPDVMHEMLSQMDRLAMLLRRRRLEGGAIELSLPEVKIDLDRGGKVKGAHLEIQTESHQVIEEFMLATNETIAAWMDRDQVPFVRRVHGAPKPIALRKMTEFVRDLGVECGSLADRFELQRVLQSVRGMGIEYAVHYSTLKSLAKAVYQVEPDRHYALNKEHYCHFTSPIRRYPDLTVHRLVMERLEKRKGRGDRMQLEALADHCSQREQRAEAAERELVKVKLLHYMSRRVGESFEGLVTGVKADGLWIRGIDIPAEGFLPVQRLPQDRYRWERHGMRLEGYRSGNCFQLGDPLRVQVHQVDLVRRQLVWGYLERLSSGVTQPRDATPSARSPGRSGKKQGDAKGGRGKPIRCKGKARRFGENLDS